ncbi:DUF4330 family protein [Haladaptatus sp. DYF46]|uniref:DUF4330 family protein n=1 Tax=Haladaptatus sp. DYF46 TaxID=2886041 RepID=UPI001E4FCAB3|nr:DUF4330 family protein [Haladaptatus sp. DYF46]
MVFIDTDVPGSVINMKLIDENGMLFGRINIIDLFVLVVVFVATVTGAAFVFDVNLIQAVTTSVSPNDSNGAVATTTATTTNTTSKNKTAPDLGSENDSSRNVTISFRARELQPYVVEEIPSGTINESSVLQVRNKTITPTTVYVPNRNGELVGREHPTLKTVTMNITIRATKQGTEVLYHETSIEIGQTIEIDLGKVSLTGNVVAIQENETA